MAAEGGVGGGEDQMTPASSPKSRLKILCSHGGKILPRPADGHLKYVGGETRVIALPRNITFSELMKKLTTLFDGDMVLKYQLTPEDLDALVSVRSDDDLRHMLDEYDRHENGGSPRLRAYLFPSTPIVVENQMATADPPALEQRYIDAINGIIRANSNVKLNPINSNRPSFSISSACSSPKTLSPEKYTVENALNQETIFSNGYRSTRGHHMHKVRSSPSLCSLTDQNGNNNNNHTIHQHHHHYYHNQYSHSHHSSKPPQDPHKINVSEMFASPLSNGRVDNLKSQMGYVPDYYYSTTRNYKGSRSGGSNKYGHFEDFGAYGYGRADRADSVPQSPRKAFWE